MGDISHKTKTPDMHSILRHILGTKNVCVCVFIDSNINITQSYLYEYGIKNHQ